MGNHWHRFISVVSTLLSVWRRQHVTNSEWITAVSPHWHKNTSTAVKTEDFGFEAINAVGSHEMVNVTLTTREISYILGLIHRNSLKYFEYDQFFSQCSLRTTALGQNILLLLLLLTLQPWVGLGLFNNSIQLLSILNLRPQNQQFSSSLGLLLPGPSILTWVSLLVLFYMASILLFFLVVLVFSILITWAAHLSLCDFINLIISSYFMLCFNSSFVLILHVTSGFCVGP